MAKKKDVRMVIHLACTECKERNYTTEKNRRNDTARIELNKYCSRCRKHTMHRETK
ncbi:MAG: 50S ribosomal protein L33 [Chloroflexi bacterium]|nr:50S ribosomal protein L33 [Chloroflexota bacterium]